MTFTLTVTMFLLSYLFPFTSSAASPSDPNFVVVEPNNADVNLTVGVTVSIPCSFNGVNNSIVTGWWQKDFNPIIKMRNRRIYFNRDYQAMTKDGRFDLIIRDVQSRDNGVYQCVGKPLRERMKFSKTIILNVVDGGVNRKKDDGTVTVVPKNDVFQGKVGTTLVIQCPLSFNTSKIKKAVWQKNFVRIGVVQNGRKSYIKPYKIIGDASTRFDLVIVNFRAKDNGTYQCVGYGAKKIYFGATITLMTDTPPPRGGSRFMIGNKGAYDLHPNNGMIDVAIGRTVIIRCPLTANVSNSSNFTLISAKWEKNWMKIGTFSKGVVTFDPPRPKINTSVAVGFFDIVISNVRVRDEGVYQCVINRRPPGQQFSKTLNLRVPIPSSKPQIYQIYSERSYPVNFRRAFAEKGQTLTLKCKANKGHPGPSIAWRVGGTLLPTNHSGPFHMQTISGWIKYEILVEGKKEPPLFRSAVSYLDIDVTDKHNNTRITCLAINPGSVKRWARTRVTIVDKVPLPGGQGSLFQRTTSLSFVLALLVPLMCRYLLM